jgi:predicted transcriptional regulator
MAVTGTFTIGEIRRESYTELAELETETCSKLDVYQYLDGALRPAAIQIVSPLRFSQPLSITALNLRRPPQSYAWVSPPHQVS